MNDNELEHQTKQALERSTQALAPEIRRSLYEARQAALSKQQRPWFKQPAMSFALAASFSAVLLVNYWPDDSAHQHSPAQIAGSQNAELGLETALDELMFFSSFDEADMEIVEDLEFAYWLSEQLENDSSTNAHTDSELRNG